MGRSAVVIGAGLGGLATAIRLQHAGWAVTVLEKNEKVGGRCNRISGDGFSFDSGPTLLLMPDVLEDLFSSVGRRLEDYLHLLRVQPNYRIRFVDGTSLEISHDQERMGEQLERMEPGAAKGFRSYLADAGYKYRVSRERFVERNFLHWYQFVTLTNLYYLLTTNTLRKLDKHAARYFRDPRLIAAFTFQTMYLGIAPHDAPAVYSLLPYTEVEEGIWFPRGGMYSLVDALVRLARELGVQIRTKTEVAGLMTRNHAVRGVQLAEGESVAADVVVSNADLPYAYDALVPRSESGAWTKWRLQRLNYGSSAFLMYLGTNRKYPDLEHHNVFLSGNIESNFDAVFRRFQLPEDPSFYVSISSRTDASLAQEGREAIYVLVPVPRMSRQVDWAVERQRFRDLMYRKLESNGLCDLRRHVVFEQTYTPEDFVTDYNLKYGSAFGISHGFSQVGYMRPSNKASNLKNLYFVGASTVPGGGIPMVIIGSRLTAQRVERDYLHG